MGATRSVVGIPREIKDDEHRVAITPDGVQELTAHDVPVVVEAGAGSDSGIPDEDYKAAGATLLSTPEEVWSQATLIAKVKEPLEEEYRYLHDDLLLFTYLHLAALPETCQSLARLRHMRHRL